MYSPKSVSTTFTPAASSAGLRWISSVVIDFDLTAMRTPWSAAELEDDLARVLRRGRPVDVAAEPLDVSPAVPGAVEVRERVFLDARAGRAARRPREALEGLAAEPDELRGGDAERFLEERSRSAAPARSGNGVAQPAPRSRSCAVSCQHLGEVQYAARASSRRDSPPPICIRQPAVAGHEAIGPGLLDVVELLVEHRRRHLGQSHRERSAEAAALVRPGQLHHLHALDPPKSPRGEARLPQPAEEMARIAVGPPLPRKLDLDPRARRAPRRGTATARASAPRAPRAAPAAPGSSFRSPGYSLLHDPRAGPRRHHVALGALRRDRRCARATRAASPR